MSEQTLNIPQLILVLIVGFFIVRWLFFSPSSGGGGSRSQTRNAGSRVNPVQVEQIAQMFPQLNRRDIMWDLQRNGGNVAATTERVLSGRGLEAPPPSFQPHIPTSAGTRPGGSSQRPAQPKHSHPDLITRYNLVSKITDSGDTSEASDASEASGTDARKPAWSSNKNERQKLLQRRREEMILAARRKLLEKEKAHT